MKTTLLLAAFILFSTPAMAVCDFILNVHNSSGHNIDIKDVQYKLHKSSWETLNFGAGMELKKGQESYPDERKIGDWGFLVTNLATSCHGTKFRFKFTYNCKNDNSGAQTRHSDIMKLSGDAVEASKVMMMANVKNCDGDVKFGLSRSSVGL